MPNSSSLLTLCTFWSLKSYRVVVNDVSAKEERTIRERKGRPKCVKGWRRREMVNLELRGEGEGCQWVARDERRGCGFRRSVEGEASRRGGLEGGSPQTWLFGTRIRLALRGDFGRTATSSIDHPAAFHPKATALARLPKHPSQTATTPNGLSPDSRVHSFRAERRHCSNRRSSGRTERECVEEMSGERKARRSRQSLVVGLAGSCGLCECVAAVQ